jgi:mannuronan synthase
MNAIPNARITHESETQRQHPRFPLPSLAIVSGREYTVKNLSSGGIALLGVATGLARGKQISLELKLPFRGFSFGMKLDAEVQYYNETDKTLGCRFINLSAEQISFLNYTIKSFIAGEIVTSESLLHVAARNNFTKARPRANNNTPAASFGRQLPGLFVVLVIGILIATLLAGNLYNSLFIVKADDAAIFGPSVAVRAMTEGIYRSELDPGLRIIQLNQAIGTITPAGGGAPVTLQSPCNCYISRTHITSGEITTRGQQVISLIPLDAKPWVVAEIEASQGKKISQNSVARVSVFGSRTRFTGHVASMESPLSGGRADGSNKAVLIKVLLDQKIPIDFVNRLATVTFAIH